MTVVAATTNHASRNGASPACSAVEKRLSHAGDREDALDDDDPADQEGGVERGDRCERDERVAHRVLGDDPSPGNALRGVVRT